MIASLPEIIGTIAGLCSTGSFVPQVVKAWREGDTEAISKKMYVMTVAAFSLWIAYGVMIASIPYHCLQFGKSVVVRGYSVS
ncbi:SemiSWEET family sugar transporter [Defluviicoccus vanus]|uniref:SemiSWEET family sugar transporter n=1 Tax=Defluviicoccus vanus TaxID=111831 RepID=UPI001CBA606E|nr:PQ-loop domain-containing transporter [Defluviicoccus vanus]